MQPKGRSKLSSFHVMVALVFGCIAFTFFITLVRTFKQGIFKYLGVHETAAGY
jgi:hypothetical protein